jgi:hypothetical protein
MSGLEMYLERHDERAGAAVWLFDNADPEDWANHFADLRKVAEWTKPGGRRAAAMLIIRDFDRPDPMTRAELARLTEAPGYDPYVAFISPNFAVRAMLTMFSWVQKTPRYEMDYFGTTDEAIVWLEGRRAALPVLRGLVRDLRAEYQKYGGDFR